MLGEVAVGASRTGTFLGERYRRIARPRGENRAIVWALLSDDVADTYSPVARF